MKNKITVLCLSDFGNTGINESLRAPLHHWHNQGHEIWQLALGYDGWLPNVKQEEYPWRERLLRVQMQDPQGRDRFGQSCISSVVEMAKPDVVITSYDVWMIAYLGLPEKDPIVAADPRRLAALGRDTRSFNHIAYFPMDGLVDGRHLPRDFDETISAFDIPVTYSRFAQAAVLRDTGIDIPFIPICHDGNIYKPGNRKLARKNLGLPEDKFIIGMVGTNQYRKLWGEFIKAAAVMARRHEDVLVLPWTTWNMQIAGGADIQDFIYREGIINQVINPDKRVGAMTDLGMAELYRAMDVCVLTTVGEGCGLPPLRARACGTPALVSDNTSNTEFAADPFELIPSYPTSFDNGSNLQRYSTDLDILVERLEALYQDSAKRDRIGAAGAKAMLQYEQSQTLPLWDRILQMAAAR